MPTIKPSTRRSYTIGEEIANSVTHGIGAIAAVTGLAVLVAFASRHGTAWHVVAVSIFGASLILLYTASALYHGIPNPRAKAVLRVIDHSAIFLLIAGSYTPFMLISLRGPLGWTLFAIIWGLAFIGIFFKITMLRRWPAMSTAMYLAMGWIAILIIKPLIAMLAPGGLVLLVLGGLAYTGGVVFYMWHSLPYHHAVWHAFVIAGSAFHFFAVLFYVIPPATA